MSRLLLLCPTVYFRVLEALEELDLVALLQGDVSLLPISLTPCRFASAPQLAHIVAGPDGYHGHLEQLLDREPNLVLARLVPDPKYHLIRLFRCHRALFGHQRRQNDLIIRHRAMPPLRPSPFRSAALR